MHFRKRRGFRLKPRLIWIWRWIFPGRSRAYRYLEPRSPLFDEKSRQGQAAAAMLLFWNRCLKIRTRRSVLFAGDGEEELPPKGHLTLYVGGGDVGMGVGPPLQRYFVPVVYFNHPLFRELLREAEEEFGFQHPGGIYVPCSVFRFERVLDRIAAAAATSQKSGRSRHCCF